MILILSYFSFLAYKKHPTLALDIVLYYNQDTSKRLSNWPTAFHVSAQWKEVSCEGEEELAPLEAPGGLRVVEPPALRARGRQRGGDLGVGDEAALQPQGLAAPDLGAAGHPCMQSSALTKYIINRERCR